MEIGGGGRIEAETSTAISKSRAGETAADRLTGISKVR